MWCRDFSQAVCRLPLRILHGIPHACAEACSGHYEYIRQGGRRKSANEGTLPFYGFAHSFSCLHFSLHFLLSVMPFVGVNKVPKLTVCFHQILCKNKLPEKFFQTPVGIHFIYYKTAPSLAILFPVLEVPSLNPEFRTLLCIHQLT
jgi:hypothetical protein